MDSLRIYGLVVAGVALAGGAYTLSLPGQFDVMDLVNGKKIGSGVSEVGVTLPVHGSALFELRPKLRDN